MAALAGVLVLSGCVGEARPPIAGSAVPTRPAPESLTARVVVGVPSAESKATLVLEDPSLVIWGTPGDWEGPASFFVVDDTITVIDDVFNVQELRVYRNGKQVYFFDFPDPAGYAVDLLIRDGRYWLLNWESIGEYRPSSRRYELALVSQHKFDESGARPEGAWVAADGSSVVAQVSTDGPELVAGPGPVTPAPKVSESGNSLLIDDGPVHLQLHLRHKPFDCVRIAQASDATYYWAAEWAGYPDGGYVYKVGNDSQVQEVFTLQRTGQRIDRRTIRVTDDGQVYQMVVADKTMKVYQIHPNP